MPEVIVTRVFVPAWDGIEIKDLPEFEAAVTTTICMN